jgi:hypothetical protein
MTPDEELATMTGMTPQEFIERAVSANMRVMEEVHNPLAAHTTIAFGLLARFTFWQQANGHTPEQARALIEECFE